MAWLPSHQELRDHPKLRKATVLLGVPRAQVIGHLHCLWWWALSYADDGDLSSYDNTDIALGAEWDGDPGVFVDALLDCGAGGKHGFLERAGDGLLLHNWDEYGGKYVEKRKRDAARKRETAAASAPDPTPPAAPSDSPPADIQRSSSAPPPEVAGREERGDRGDRGEHASDKPKPRSAVPLPPSWAPNDNHREIARAERVDLALEAEQFKDFHRAKGSKFKDWDASFRTWLRNVNKFTPPHLRAVGGDDPPKVIYT